MPGIPDLICSPQGNPSFASSPSQPHLTRTPWYRPPISPEHGVYVVLLASFLTGAAAAQQWTWTTTIALVSAVCGFQAEHPLVMQIKQRKRLKPRFLLWGGLYAAIALSIAGGFWLIAPDRTPFYWIYGGAIAAFGIDALAVLHREQKSVVNEGITFAAVCLSAPFAYVATTGSGSPLAIGLWLLNTLVFVSSIFTVKLRKSRAGSSHSGLIAPVATGVIYHAIASLILVAVVAGNMLPVWTASAFGVVLAKFALILARINGYSAAPIRTVALLETLSALLFGAIACVSLLPVRLL